MTFLQSLLLASVIALANALSGFIFKKPIGDIELFEFEDQPKMNKL